MHTRIEKARLQSEAKAAEEARKQAEAEAASEAKRKRELEREAARQALLQACQTFFSGTSLLFLFFLMLIFYLMVDIVCVMQMEKTAEINENSLFLKDLEMLSTIPAEHVPSSVGETSPARSQEDIGCFKFGGSNPLEQLGLYMKADDEEEEDGEPSTIFAHDVEEGEID